MRTFLAVSFLGLMALAAIDTRGAAQAGSAQVSCVTSTTQARNSGYGYDHIVVLQSTCEKDVECDVTTDVNPKATTVTVAAGAKTEVVTFRGSPASTFTASVGCHAK